MVTFVAHLKITIKCLTRYNQKVVLAAMLEGKGMPSNMAANTNHASLLKNQSTIKYLPSNGFVVLPYVQGISERISRILRQQQIKVAFKPLRTVNSLFPRPKAQEKVDRTQSGTVYKISCVNCSFVYYGQTERSLNTRITEHKRAVSMFDHDSKISCHVHENNHIMDFGSVKVVGHEANYHER